MYDMTDIKAFRAIKPRTDGRYPEDLKKLLEPETDHKDIQLKSYLTSFRKMLKSGYFYMEDKPSIYIYENNSQLGIQRGIWTLTEINDSVVQKIIQHEQTLLEHQDKIQAYREQVGLEGEPILLTYYPEPELDDLMTAVISEQQPECMFHEDIIHKFWRITDASIIKSFEQAFRRIKTLYVADGHHRLSAAQSMRHDMQQWMSTLYISTDQIRVREFNRLIIPDIAVNEKDLFNLLYQYFHISAIPNNIPYSPDHHHRIGMCINGKWYQLNLKAELEEIQQESDTVILQEYIFRPFFGISEPRGDQRLKTYDPVKGWPELVRESKENPGTIAFTLYPMSIQQLLAYADQQKHLPPKSTWIEPKVPYGLLIHLQE